MVERTRESLRISDSAWAKVEPLISRSDPASLDGAREHLGAMLTRVLTGRSWEALAADFPEWSDVWVICTRWQQLGLLEELSQALLVKLDD